MKKVYGINNLDPSKNIVHGIGSKPVLALLPICLINPGDITLATSPGYGVTSTYTRYLGGSVYKGESPYFVDSMKQAILEKSPEATFNYPKLKPAAGSYLFAKKFS